jgi:sugar (pentulose or hexulose) kinase
VAEAYSAIRPPFSETGSPRLGMGLNIGAQLFWQFGVDPDLKDRARTIVTYPQYWGHRLTGMAATDVTSLGCHTDLWNPHENRFSSLVETLGIADKIAPARRSDEVLGTVLPEIAAATGLRRETPVHVGIHDSNASLLPHLLANEPPFSVVSTGTWVIAMAIGGRVLELGPEKDTLINVNARGEPVPSARFMGGREHDVATVETYPVPTDADLHDILSEQTMLLPAVEKTCGPFKGRQARWHGTKPNPGTARIGAAVALYLALVNRECLRNIGHEGLIVVEGPFANNRVFLRMLATLTDSQVATSNGITGTSQGAALLVRQEPLKSAPAVTISPELGDMQRLMLRYADCWQAEIGTR